MVEAHLATCPTCSPLYAALVGMPPTQYTAMHPDAALSAEEKQGLIDALRTMDG